MSIVVYGTVVSQDRVAVVGSVKITQEGVFVSENGIIVPKTITKELNGSGYFSQELDTPISGTVLTTFELPTGHTYGINLATGAATDLAELITSEGSAVAASDLQTLLQLEKILTITNVTAEYTVLATDEYIRADGTFTITLVPAILTQPPIVIKNIGTGTITVSRAGSDTISGATTYTLYSGERHGFVVGAAGLWDA